MRNLWSTKSTPTPKNSPRPKSSPIRKDSGTSIWSPFSLKNYDHLFSYSTASPALVFLPNRTLTVVAVIVFFSICTFLLHHLVNTSYLLIDHYLYSVFAVAFVRNPHQSIIAFRTVRRTITSQTILHWAFKTTIYWISVIAICTYARQSIWTWASQNRRGRAECTISWIIIWAPATRSCAW